MSKCQRSDQAGACTAFCAPLHGFFVHTRKSTSGSKLLSWRLVNAFHVLKAHLHMLCIGDVCCPPCWVTSAHPDLCGGGPRDVFRKGQIHTATLLLGSRKESRKPPRLSRSTTLVPFRILRCTRGAVKGASTPIQLFNKGWESPHRLDELAIVNTIPRICLAL